MISQLASKVALAGSTASRLVAGLGAIIILAWSLEPVEYGLLVTMMAASRIIGVVTNFGFPIQLLRDVGEKPESAGELLSASVRIKNIFVIFLSAILVLAVNLFAPDALDIGLTVILIYLSVTLNSYNEMVTQTLKGLQLFRLEAMNAVAGNLVYLGAIVSTLFFTSELIVVAIALFVARFAQLCVSFWLVAKQTQLDNLIYAPVRNMLGFMRRSASVGIDGTMTAIAAQVDVLLVSALFGLEVVGAYQIISSLSNYALLPAQILMSAFLPKLTGTADQSVKSVLKRQMQIEYIVIGAIAAAGFLSLYLLYPYVLGEGYQLELAIWIGFSLLILTKYIVSLIGVFLVIGKKYKARIAAQFVNSLVIIVGFIFVLPLLEIEQAPLILICAYVMTGIVYSVGNRHTG